MNPRLLSPLSVARSVNNDAVVATDGLRAQWINPSDIFSVLLLLGPEIVRRAVAQLAGRRITPVAFSFGWVAYSAHALLAVFGDLSLMPDSEMANTVVIGAQTGHVRSTTSWLLGKLLHELDGKVDEEMKAEGQHVPPDSTPHVVASDKPKAPQQGRPWEALRISVYETIDEPQCVHGVPHCDWVWYLGFAVILLQLLIAVIPVALQQEWVTLFITAYGNILAISQGSLHQWRKEKWACPTKGGATTVLTQGNGSRHATVILGKKGVGLDLEILALGTRTTRSTRMSRFFVVLLAVNWIVLLVTAAGLKPDTWYLLCIGALGSMQNPIAAAAPRQPSALGVHIRDTKRVIRGPQVAQVLKEAEKEFPGLGISLAPVFFPGSMRIKEADIDFWRNAQQQRLAPNKWGVRLDNLPPPDPILEVEKSEERHIKQHLSSTKEAGVHEMEILQA